MPTTRQHLVEQYRQLLADVYAGCAAAPAHPELPPELQFQSWWAAGLLPKEPSTLRNGAVRILDTGRWNRLPGPDFTHAEIELNGTRIRGDIEIDPCAQDWERHGHGANPEFNHVVLHVVLTPPPAGWYTRNSEHQDIPILYLPPETWQNRPTHHADDDALPRCRQPLADMPAESIQKLLLAAAAYRMEHKRTLLRQRIAAAGEHQAWYEAWATTLGYSANKDAMLMLAMRSPIKELGAQSEAILLGTAGFLFPVLPENVGADARQYHRGVWDSWWMLREQYELAPERSLPWCKAPSRPLNHPQRRVAALAATTPLWPRILPLLNAAGAAELSHLLSSVSHPFWDTHYTLSSAPMKSRAALIGQPRIADFLINYVYVNDEAPHAWESYIRIKQGDLPTGIDRTVWHLFGDRADLKSTLRCAYAQQALLQIDADFCARNICLECAFPAQLCQWAR
ncbi:MAG: DUF2851 family protein [Akkermansia sp.]|nr:DUF2851 family protein [Akkermansia sp.]